MDTLTVKQASELLGLSPHTLRYYEKARLIEPVARTRSGHRRYDTQDVEHFRFLHCLRRAGMPIRRVRAFADLSRKGRSTIDARIELLHVHRRELSARIAELRELVNAVDGKIGRLREAGQHGRASENGAKEVRQ